MSYFFDPRPQSSGPQEAIPDNRPGNPLHLEQPFKVTLSFTETCNLDCRLCYADCGASRRPELTTQQWLDLLDRLAEDGVIFLYIEGGEPFLRPDLLDVLGQATGRFFTMLRTNGTLVSEAVAEQLAAINVGIVLVDVWGARAETHDFLTGIPGSFERSCAAIQRLVRAGIETQMLVILNRHNVSELNDYLALARSLDVATVGLLRLYPLGRVKRQWRDLALSLDEMTTALDSVQPPPGVRIMQSWHPKNANCCWQMAAINAYGDSIGCSYLREYVNYGNVLETPFLQTWEHPLSRKLRAGQVEQSCPECTGTQGSRGGCRSTAFAFHGRFDAPDPFDAGLNQGVDLRELPEHLLRAPSGRQTPSDL